MKRLAIAAAAVIGVLLVAALIIPCFTGPNRYRPLLEEHLSRPMARQVGRGDLKLSLLAGAVRASDLSIADYPAFSRRPAQASHTRRCQSRSNRPLVRLGLSVHAFSEGCGRRFGEDGRHVRATRFPRHRRRPVRREYLSVLRASAQTSNPHAEPADRESGARIFRSHCASCHGLRGTGGLGPDLTTGSFFHGSSDADLFSNIANGIPGTAMPGVFFEGTQVWQIVAFVRSLSGTGAPSPAAGDAARGQRLFRQQGCIGCHLVRGEGGLKGPELSVIGSQRSGAYLRESILDPDSSVSQDFWVAKIITKDGSSHSGFVMNQDTYMVQILDFSRGLQAVPRSEFKDFGIDRSSLMPAYKGRMTEAEVNDLVSYLLSLKRQPGRSE